MSLLSSVPEDLDARQDTAGCGNKTQALTTQSLIQWTKGRKQSSGWGKSNCTKLNQVQLGWHEEHGQNTREDHKQQTQKIWQLIQTYRGNTKVIQKTKTGSTENQDTGKWDSCSWFRILLRHITSLQFLDLYAALWLLLSSLVSYKTILFELTLLFQN